MHLTNAKNLLMFIQVGDHRNVTDADIALWGAELPDDLEMEDAYTAVRLFRSRPETELMKFPYLDLAVFRVFVRKATEARRVEARRQAALGAGPAELLPPVSVRSTSAKDPAKFAELFHEGRAVGNADRAFKAAKLRGLSVAEAKAAGQAAYQDAKNRISAERATHADRDPLLLRDI